MSILLDVIILAVLALFVWLGAKRGFILTLCGLLAAIVALVGANLIAGFLAPKVSQALEPVITQQIQDTLREQYEAAISDLPVAASGALSQEALPIDSDLVQTFQRSIPIQDVLDALRDMGFYEEFVDSVDKAVEEGAIDLAADAAASVASALAQAIAYRLIFLISFLLLLLVWNLLSHTLDLVARLPGLHFLNKTLGGALGFVKGCILLFVAAWVINLSGASLIPEAAARESLLLPFFLSFNPLDYLMGSGILPVS